MPAQSRLGDKSQVPADAHGCPACPHPAIGPAVGGSPDVFVNGKPAIRVGDPGIHAACCGPNTWTAKLGSATVIINGKPAHRLNDMDQHCGGIGKMIEGSPDVFCGGPPAASASPAAGKAQTAALSAASSGGPGAPGSGQGLLGDALAKAQEMGAAKLSGLANDGLGKVLAKLGVPPGVIAKIKQVAGPMIHSIVDDLVHGRTPDLGKAFGAGLEAVKGLALGEIKDKILGPLKEKIGELTKGLNSAMLSGLGPATSKLDGAIKGAIAGAVSGAVGGALNSGLNGFVDSAFKGENPLAGAWDGVKGGAKSGAGSGAWDGGKDGWKEYDKRNKAVMAWQEEQKKQGPQPEKVAAEPKVKKKGAPKKPAEPEYSGPAWYEKKGPQGNALFDMVDEVDAYAVPGIDSRPFHASAEKQAGNGVKGQFSMLHQDHPGGATVDVGRVEGKAGDATGGSISLIDIGLPQSDGSKVTVRGPNAGIEFGTKSPTGVSGVVVKANAEYGSVTLEDHNGPGSSISAGVGVGGAMWMGAKIGPTGDLLPCVGGEVPIPGTLVSIQGEICGDGKPPSPELLDWAERHPGMK